MGSLREKVNMARRRQRAQKHPLSRDGNQIIARTDDVAGLLEAVDGVRQIHIPEEVGFGRPARCRADRADWPCPTQRALSGAA